MDPRLPPTDQTKPRLVAVAELTDDIGLSFRWARLCEIDRELADAFAFNVEFRLSQTLDAAERREECNQERRDAIKFLRDGR